MSEEAVYLREMDKPCARCGAATGVACANVVLRGPRLDLVFPCGMSFDEVRARWKELVPEVKRRMTEMAEADIPRTSE